MEATIAYIRYMTKRGRRYVYLQRSYRVPGRRTPKTESKYLGRDDGFARSMATLERENKAFDAWQKKTFGETGAERQAREAQERQFSQDTFLQETEVDLQADCTGDTQCATSSSTENATTGKS